MIIVANRRRKSEGDEKGANDPFSQLMPPMNIKASVIHLAT